MTTLEADKLDQGLQTLLGNVACVTSPFSEESYIRLFEEVKFRILNRANHNQLLAEMVNRTRENAKLPYGLAQTRPN